MAWEICVIDDKIPVTGNIEIDDTLCLNASMLKLLLDKNAWDEQEVRDLIEKLCATETWTISAFTHPSFYLKSSRDNNYRPDIIIFDWDYPGQTNVTKDLLEVLQSCFSLVFVYTRVDKEEEVRREIEKEEFREHKERIYLEHKWGDDSLRNLLNKVREKYEDNFSFRFGKTLRNLTSKAIEGILVSLGKSHINFIKGFLGKAETPEADIKALLAERLTTNILENGQALDELMQGNGMDEAKAQNLLSIIKSRFRDEIKSLDLGDLRSTGDCGGEDISSLVDLWSYRLYYDPQDKIVRTGDIVKKGESYFIIVTPECYLLRFWSKTYGYLNLVPLWEIEEDMDKYRANLKRSSFKNTCPSSVSNKPDGYTEGCFLLPYVKRGQSFLNFIVMSKAICSEKIDCPEGRNKDTALSYDILEGCKRIASLSEPFLTPLVSSILSAILGTGTPDYPSKIKNDIQHRFEETCARRWPTR